MADNWQTEYHRYHRHFVNLNQLYRRPESKIYTEIVLSFLTAAFFIFFAIRPTLVTIAGLVKTIEDQKTVNQKLDAKIVALEKADEEFRTVQDNLALVTQALPVEAGLATLINELEIVAKMTGTNLETIQFDPVGLQGQALETEDKKTEEPTLTFALTATGQYENLKSFLDHLNTLRRLVSTKEFAFGQPQIKKTEAEWPEGTLILTLNAQGHFLIKN